ncbi:AraC family transcriptional regulator [Actinoallomurus sp. NPDC052308]|uniref:helix-turn-helix domain-containing protein n=1 Tax=Actinoallomurus sp. NPDC052308 TaxID=3155530 RepID=UPI00341D5DA8
MLSSVLLADSPEFSVAAVRCGGHRSGWSATEAAARHEIVLVRSGRFRLRRDGREAVVDPTRGYVQVPGDEASFAHPAGGDVCTAISLSTGFWRAVTDDAGPSARPAVPVDGRLDLAHRRLLRSTSDVAFAMAEELVGLLTEVLRRAADAGTVRPHRAVRGPGLADQAREAILADHPDAAGLVTLARLLGVSPSHLSRVFHRETGLTLTRYRNRVRAGRALDRIEQGAHNLAEVAADLGFADQAHLARTVKAEFGRTSTEIRRLLGAVR